jgi:hypothetical protein
MNTKCHINAMRETIEISLIAGCVALFSDLIWLSHDILSNGLSAIYVIVGTGLIAGLALTGIALYHHHWSNVKCATTPTEEKIQQLNILLRSIEAHSILTKIHLDSD